MFDEGSGVSVLAGALSQGLFPNRQRTQLSEPGLQRDEQQQRQMRRAETEVADPAPAAPSADQDRDLAEDHEGDDARVQRQDGVGEQGG